MTTRTFQQHGLGYSVEPITITATINGVVAYEGPVVTLDEPPPSDMSDPNAYAAADILFTWANTVDFEGTASIEIAVHGSGTLMLAKTMANYSAVYTPNPDSTLTVSSSGPDGYLGYFYQSIDGVVYSDPYIDSAIDGMEVPRPGATDPSITGQWYYMITTGSTFTGTLSIQPGIEQVITTTVLSPS
jgi:hypothetical protein